MNPPRFELDHAIRLFFAAHGITIKKSHILEYGKTASPPGRRKTKGKEQRTSNKKTDSRGQHGFAFDNT
jgi:hypothetical protein